MTSFYITKQECDRRENALFIRLAKEAQDIGPAGITWPPDSDYWKLPNRAQEEVRNIVFRI